MVDYVTAEEKAIEWGVTPRHVQYLCRSGKIDGAVKRVGAWFIPAGTPVPVKNSKTNVKAFKFVGTKKRIFEASIELFTLNGFERVNVTDIADRVGIRQSTVYNHFKSKREILDTIYDYYCYQYTLNRPATEDIEDVIRSGSLLDLIHCVVYDFDEDCRQKMSDISKIIFQRSGIDERAREITKSLTVEEGVKYVEAVFDKVVEYGRLSAFDTHAMAVLINSVRLFVFYNWIMDPSPEYLTKIINDENTLYKHAAELLTSITGFKPMPSS